MPKKRSYNYESLGKQEQSTYKLSTETLHQFLCFIVSISNPKVKKADIQRLKTLLSSLDSAYYMSSPDKADLIRVLNILVNTIIEKDIVNRDVVLAMTKDLVDNSSINKSKVKELDDKAIELVKSIICSYNASNYFFTRVDALVEKLSEVKTATPLEYTSIINSTCELMREIVKEHDKAMATNEIDAVDLREFSFVQNVKTAHSVLSNPSNRLLTGMQGFNALTDGGLELGRCTIIMGLSGEGKSGFMLNLAVQIKLFNRDFKTANPALKPCVVYISQENSKFETIERLYAVTTDNENFSSIPVDEVLEKMRTVGQMIVTDDNPINIFMIYRSPFTNTTAYFSEVIDALEENGYETICMIHDYIQRINAANPSYRGDLRLELGQILNEEVTLAKERHIAFITAGQLNRAADDKIADLKDRNKTNLVTQVRRSNIGESIQLLHNADMVLALARETDATDNQEYLGIRVLKNRGRRNNEGDTIFQPFYPDSGIRLMIDVDGPPLFKVSLNTHGPNRITEHYEAKTAEDLDSIFDSASTPEKLAHLRKAQYGFASYSTESPFKDPSFEDPYDGNGYWELDVESSLFNPSDYTSPADIAALEMEKERLARQDDDDIIEVYDKNTYRPKESLLSLVKSTIDERQDESDKVMAMFESISLLPAGDVIDDEAVAITTEECYQAEKGEPEPTEYVTDTPYPPIFDTSEAERIDKERVLELDLGNGVTRKVDLPKRGQSPYYDQILDMIKSVPVALTEYPEQRITRPFGSTKPDQYEAKLNGALESDAQEYVFNKINEPKKNPNRSNTIWDPVHGFVRDLPEDTKQLYRDHGYIPPSPFGFARKVNEVEKPKNLIQHTVVPHKVVAKTSKELQDIVKQQYPNRKYRITGITWGYDDDTHEHGIIRYRVILDDEDEAIKKELERKANIQKSIVYYNNLNRAPTQPPPNPSNRPNVFIGTDQLPDVTQERRGRDSPVPLVFSFDSDKTSTPVEDESEPRIKMGFYPDGSKTPVPLLFNCIDGVIPFI